LAETGTIHEDARTLPLLARADVLVVGGGTAGVAAAIAAARGGARVVLAEASSSLGGLATNGLIALLLTLDDGRGRQVIAGICQNRRAHGLSAAFAPPRCGRPTPLIDATPDSGSSGGPRRHVVRYSWLRPEIMPSSERRDRGNRSSSTSGRASAVAARRVT
jgi:predicted oxidoreductase